MSICHITQWSCECQPPEVECNGLERLRGAYESWRDEAKRQSNNAAILAQQVADLTAELDAVRALMNCYNLGGWTDALAPMQRALKAEEERDALRAEIQAMHRADDAYGAGFYNQDAWLTPYNKLRHMTAVDAARGKP